MRFKIGDVVCVKDTDVIFDAQALSDLSEYFENELNVTYEEMHSMRGIVSEVSDTREPNLQELIVDFKSYKCVVLLSNEVVLASCIYDELVEIINR